MAQQRSNGNRGTNKTARGGGRANGSRSASDARGSTRLDTAHLEGRNPSHDPDVFVDIERVKVDEIYVDVEHLDAHLALRAKLANLLQVVAGVHVSLGKVVVDVKGVEAEARLKVRLENLYDILDRALSTLDRNPQILESLVHTVDDAVSDIGQLGQQALGPGGAVTQTLGDVGQVAQHAVGPGGVASSAVAGLGNAAGQAVGQRGAVGHVAQGLNAGGSPLRRPVAALGKAVGQLVRRLGQGAAVPATNGAARTSRQAPGRYSAATWATDDHHAAGVSRQRATLADAVRNLHEGAELLAEARRSPRQSSGVSRPSRRRTSSA